jgi:hypothetical protein
MTYSFMGIHRDHHGCPDPIDDHLPERRLGNVWNILSHRVTQNKGVMKLICFWNCQRVDRRRSEKFREDPKVIRRVPKEFQSNGELNKK